MDGLGGFVIDGGGSLLLLFLRLLIAYTKVGWKSAFHGDLERRLFRDGGCGKGI